MSSRSDTIRTELCSWPGVTATPHRFGGIEFRVGRRELGHLHGDRLADIPFPVKIREQLVADGRARVHHVMPESGWVSYYIRSDADVPGAIELFRLNFERPWQRDAAHDVVDEASEDSFPASDPPGFGPVTGVGHQTS